VPIGTAEKRLKLADEFEALPAKAKQAVVNRETTISKERMKSGKKQPCEKFTQGSGRTRR